MKRFLGTAEYTARFEFEVKPNVVREFNLFVDTGSSWTWVNTCDPIANPFWKTKTCPSFYLNIDGATSIKCTNKNKFIIYGSGLVAG